MNNNVSNWSKKIQKRPKVDLTKPIKQMNLKEKKAYFEELAFKNVIGELDRHKEQQALRKFNHKILELFSITYCKSALDSILQAYVHIKNATSHENYDLPKHNEDQQFIVVEKALVFAAILHRLKSVRSSTRNNDYDD